MDQKYSLIISPNFEDVRFWPRFPQQSAYTNFKFKKKPSERKKKENHSFMMCSIDRLRYQGRKSCFPSQGEVREERARERDEPQESTALSHVPATAKASGLDTLIMELTLATLSWHILIRGLFLSLGT